MTVSEIIEEVITEICESYCRHPYTVDDDDELLQDYCSKCPLNKLT